MTDKIYEEINKQYAWHVLDYMCHKFYFGLPRWLNKKNDA